MPLVEVVRNHQDGCIEKMYVGRMVGLNPSERRTIPLDCWCGAGAIIPESTLAALVNGDVDRLVEAAQVVVGNWTKVWVHDEWDTSDTARRLRDALTPFLVASGGEA
jgi:hypothetical protein